LNTDLTDFTDFHELTVR